MINVYRLFGQRLYLYASLTVVWLTIICTGLCCSSVFAGENDTDDFNSDCFSEFVSNEVLKDTKSYLGKIKLEAKHFKQLTKMLIDDGDLSSEDDKKINGSRWSWSGVAIHQRFATLLEIAGDDSDARKFNKIMSLLFHPETIKGIDKKGREVLSALGKKIKTDYRQWVAYLPSAPPPEDISPSDETVTGGEDESDDEFMDAYDHEKQPGPPASVVLQESDRTKEHVSGTVPESSNALPLLSAQQDSHVKPEIEMRADAPLPHALAVQTQASTIVSGSASGNASEEVDIDVAMDFLKKYLHEQKVGLLRGISPLVMDWPMVALSWLSVGGAPAMVVKMYQQPITERIDYLLSEMLTQSKEIDANFLLKLIQLVNCSNEEGKLGSFKHNIQLQMMSYAESEGKKKFSALMEKIAESFPDWKDDTGRVDIISDFFKNHRDAFQCVSIQHPEHLEQLIGLAHNPHAVNPTLAQITSRLRMLYFSMKEKATFTSFGRLLVVVGDSRGVEVNDQKGVPVLVCEHEAREAIINVLQQLGTNEEKLCIAIMSNGGILAEVDETYIAGVPNENRKRTANELASENEDSDVLIPVAKKCKYNTENTVAVKETPSLPAIQRAKISLERLVEIKQIATGIGTSWKWFLRSALAGSSVSLSEIEAKIGGITRCNLQNPDMFIDMPLDAIHFIQNTSAGTAEFAQRLEKGLKEASLMKVCDMIFEN